MTTSIAVKNPSMSKNDSRVGHEPVESAHNAFEDTFVESVPAGPRNRSLELVQRPHIPRAFPYDDVSDVDTDPRSMRDILLDLTDACGGSGLAFYALQFPLVVPSQILFVLAVDYYTAYSIFGASLLFIGFLSFICMVNFSLLSVIAQLADLSDF
jgi:hypothetical protein